MWEHYVVFVPLCKFKWFQGTHLRLYKYYMSAKGKDGAKHSVPKKKKVTYSTYKKCSLEEGYERFRKQKLHGKN